MNFTDIFIKRPVLAVVLSSLILLLGLQSANQLEIREFPKLEEGLITVETFYRGASAETVQGFVTTPLQQFIAGAKGVEYITSSSRQGVSVIEIRTRLGSNTSEVLTEVITKINVARSHLPREIENPVAYTDTPGSALMYLAFYSKNQEMNVEQITDYLMRSVQPEIATLEGVGTAELFGANRFSMRIWTDPKRMAALGVTAEDIRDAIQNNNYIATTGSTKGQWVLTSVSAETDLTSTDEFGNIVVRQNDERRVRLSDVADIELASESSSFYSSSSGREAMFVVITTAPGANPLVVAQNIKDLLPSIRTKMPADLTVTIDNDASVYIDQAIFQVVKTLAEAALIVILVIFLFLGSFRVVVIPIIAIPLSLIGVLFFIFLAGYSINLLTLLALVIAIGLVVDDAIVVVENVHRYIEAGEQPMEAALKGARQVALPVLAMSITLAAVYAPIGFLGGLTGILFSEFAFTLAGAVIVSGVVALTLSPVMCANFLRDHDHQGRLADWLDERFLILRNAYEKMLTHCLNNRGAVVFFGLCIFLSLPALISVTQKELAPQEDQGMIYVFTTQPDHTNLDYLNRFTGTYKDIWSKIPEVKFSFQVNSQNMAFGGIILHPWDERERTQQVVQQEIQQKYSQIAGLEIHTFGEAPLPGSDAGLPVNFVLSATADYKALVAVGEEVVKAARDSGHFLFVKQSLKFNRPEINVHIDREKAARLGISMRSVGDTLALMLGESDVNRFSMEGRSYKVIPQAPRDFRLTKEWLERYYIRTASSDLVPLSTIITLSNEIKPNNLSQFQQLNSTSIEGMLTPGTSLGTALAFLEQKANEVTPKGYRISYEGESRRFIQEESQFLILFMASLLLVYLVLAAQFNSFRDPFVVLLCVPMSTFGALVPLALGYATLNIYTQIGLVTLIGLISKHGILIVDFANQRRKQGLDIREAILEAASLRLRPILMTTAATSMGIAPLLFAFGAGANSRFSIGLVITSGLLVGTLFTLFVVPVYYMAIEGKRNSDEKPALEAAESIEGH